MHACLYRELTELKVVDTMYMMRYGLLWPACLLLAGIGHVSCPTCGESGGGVFFTSSKSRTGGERDHRAMIAGQDTQKRGKLVYFRE